jgi:hypothetical protein
MEMLSIYLGMPIEFNRYENSKHGQKMLSSMLENVPQIGRSKLRIAQKMHALKMSVFPRIDYRMICADLSRKYLERPNAQIPGGSASGSGFMEFLSSRSRCHGRMVSSRSHQSATDRTH